MVEPMNYSSAWREDRAFRYRSAILIAILAPCAMLNNPGGRAFDAVAMAAIVLGVGLRLWAVRRLGKRARVHSPRAGVLETDGPYRYVRNPIYCANGAIAMGFALLACPWPYAPTAALLMALAYHVVVIVEERFLAQAFGEQYAAYRRAVPRWLPAFKPGPPPGNDPPVPWSEVLMREGAAVVGVAMALGIVAARRAYYDPGPAWEWGLSAAAGAIGAAATWAQVRWKAARHDARRVSPASEVISRL